MSPMKMRTTTRVNSVGGNATNRANKPPVRAAAAQMDANWPLKCICNLCQCGQHRCSNFGLDERLSMQLAAQANSSATMDLTNGALLDNGDMGSMTDESLASPGPLGRHERAIMGCQHHINCNYNNSGNNNDDNNNNCCMLDERYLTPARRPASNNKQSPGPAASRGTGNVNNSSGGPLVRRCNHHDDNNRTLIDDSNELAPSKHLDDSELVHVLVTRPEIASKPKDNIIFEGDMDLKTTFETSYEALAKMRLDQWRRHQEVAGAASAANKQRQSGAEASSESVSVDKSINRSRSVTIPTGRGAASGRDYRHAVGKRDTAAAAEAGWQPQQQRQTGGRLRQRSDANAPADENDELADDRSVLAGNFEHGRQLQDSMHKARHLNLSMSPGARPAAAEEHEAGQSRLASSSDHRHGSVQQMRPLADGNEQSHSRHLARATPTLVSGSPISHKRTSPAHPAQLTPEPSRPATVAVSTPSPSQQQQQPQPNRLAAGVASHRQTFQQKRQQSQPVSALESNYNTNDNYVDPDLSPIIVYDANLNRLERVGIRRRSKYRPSTSLRLGAGGLFGDSASSSQGQNDEAANNIDQTIISEGTQTQSGDRRIGAGATSKEMDRYRDLDSSGKKHLLNHTGRRDHIKEQEVAELKLHEDKGTLTEELRRGSEALSAAAAAELRIAEEEESAAVAEIQRCTRSVEGAYESTPLGQGELVGRSQAATVTPDRQQQLAAAASGDSGQVKPASDCPTGSRQSRQQRTCQNQSFYIFENEYPDSRGAIDDNYCIKIGGRESADPFGSTKTTTTPAASRALDREQQSGSPFGQNLRLAKGKNLFRESPDFILTTGAGRNSRGPQMMHQQQTVGRDSAVSSSRGDHQGTGLGADNGRGSASGPVADGHFSAASDIMNDEDYHNNTTGCRVLNLDNNFEFVGLKSGHKYFVERQTDLAS